jgi:uncharacterized protein
MSKLDAAGAKSLEEILASIRKTLSGNASDAASAQLSAAPMPAPATPEPKAPAETDSDDTRLLSAKLAGALSEPVNGAALDDDLSEILAPENKDAAPSNAAGTAKPAAEASDGKDPLWFLRHPSAAAETESSATQAPTDEVKLSRPEVLRASLPPLFGAGEERSTIFRTAPIHTPKALDSGNIPTTKMQPVSPPPSEAGKMGARSGLTARTQPAMPLTQPADETAKAAPPARTDAGSSEIVAAALVAREPASIEEVVAVPVAEAAPDTQAPPETKADNGSLGDVAGDTANKAPVPMEELSTKTAAATDAAQARSLEQMVGELLEPVMRHWLETNLPRMVEKVVRDEVARALAAERRAPKP